MNWNLVRAGLLIGLLSAPSAAQDPPAGLDAPDREYESVPIPEYEPVPLPATVDDITGTPSLLKEETFRKPGPTMELGLEDAIEVAMDLNPNIRSSERGLEASVADLDLVESAYRGNANLDLTGEETFRRNRGGGQFRFDPQLGLISENEITSDNSELITIGPTYNQRFKNGSTLTFSPEFQYIRSTERGFDRGSGNPDGNRDDTRSNFNVQYTFPFNSRPREQIRRDIENAQLSTIQSDYDLYQTRKIIAEQVINNYWNILRFQENLDITNERLLQARKIEFTLRVQFENESAALVEVNQAQVDVLNQEATLIEQEGALRSSIENFNLLLGVPVETSLVLRDELEVSALPMPADDYIEMITSTNLDLKSLRLNIQQQENNLRVARLGQQPDINASAFFNRDDEGAENGGLALFFSWPFLDGGSTKARVRALTERLEANRIQLWELERQLVQEAYQDLRNLQLQEQRIEILNRNVRQAEVTLENALIMFREFGRITFREMQDFQIDVARNRSDLVGAKVSYNIAKSNLLEKVHDYEPSTPFIESMLDQPR